MTERGRNRPIYGIDFSDDDGERVANIGRNGAGKSTLLRASLGMIYLSEREGEWLYG